jgi:hypothetical protein
LVRHPAVNAKEDEVAEKRLVVASVFVILEIGNARSRNVLRSTIIWKGDIRKKKKKKNSSAFVASPSITKP